MDNQDETFLESLPDGVPQSQEEHLMWAADTGDYVNVDKYLSDKNIDVNLNYENDDAFYLDGDSAMHMALGKRHIEVADLILQHPDFCAEYRNGNESTALHYAAKFDDRGEMAHRLLAKVDCETVNMKDFELSTALLISCLYGNIQMIRALLTVEGIDVYAEDEERFTPMLIAVENNQFFALEELLGNGVCPNFPSPGGGPNLITEAINGTKLRMVDRLIKYGAYAKVVVPLKLTLNLKEGLGLFERDFDTPNIATTALKACIDAEQVDFEDALNIAAKSIHASQYSPDDDTIFKLYASYIKSKERRRRGYVRDEQRNFTISPELTCEVMNVLCKSFGANVNGDRLKYLMFKYNLTMEKDCRLLRPYTTKTLKQLSALKSREVIVRKTGEGNVVRAMATESDCWEGCVTAAGLVKLDWCDENYFAEHGNI